MLPCLHKQDHDLREVRRDGLEYRLLRLGLLRFDLLRFDLLRFDLWPAGKVGGPCQRVCVKYHALVIT